MILVFFASCVGAVVAMLSGMSWWRWVSAPALLLSGWAALGHLVTFDDDLPSGWSNPGESKAFWQRSLVEFALKALLFVGLVWLVVTDWSR